MQIREVNYRFSCSVMFFMCILLLLKYRSLKILLKSYFWKKIVEKYLDVADINSPNLTSDCSKWVCTGQLSKSWFTTWYPLRTFLQKCDEDDIEVCSHLCPFHSRRAKYLSEFSTGEKKNLWRNRMTICPVQILLRSELAEVNLERWHLALIFWFSKVIPILKPWKCLPWRTKVTPG